MICFNMSYKYKCIILFHLINSILLHTGKRISLHCDPSQDLSLQLTRSCERPVEEGDINLVTKAATTSFLFHILGSRPMKVDTFQFLTGSHYPSQKLLLSLSSLAACSSLIFFFNFFHREDKLPQVQGLRSQTLHL